MSRPKLLLADDSVAIRKVVELTFTDEEIDVFSAPDADSAMQKFVDLQPDIVLLDVGLDGTSGYQICEMIKGDEATKHIPVLLLVGSFEPFDHDAAERSGADGVLTKPFQSIRELVERVSDLLGRGDTSHEPEQDFEADVATAAADSELATDAKSEVEEESGLAPTDEHEVEPREATENDATLTETTEDKVESDAGEDDDYISDEELNTYQQAEDDAASAATVPAVDLADIEHLYNSSFAETVRMDEYDTLEDLVEDEPDDKLIQTEKPGVPDDELIEVTSFAADQAVEDEIGEDRSEAALVKEFDWSPAAKVESTDEDVEQHADFPDVSQVRHSETDDLVSELAEWMSDDSDDRGGETVPETHWDSQALHGGGAETVAESHADQPNSEQGPGEPEEVLPESAFEEASSENVAASEDAAPTMAAASAAAGFEDLSEVPQAASEDEGLPEMSPQSSEGGESASPMEARSDAYGEEDAAQEVTAPAEPAISADSALAEPSEELIELIVQRVVERLSDSVIREVAQETVPRIAEKVVREALLRGEAKD